MRELHVIGFTSDHGGLLLAAKPGAKTGSYFLTLDAAVLEQIEAARLARAGLLGIEVQRAPRLQVESALSPREIQARLRSGRTVAQVALEAGVTAEWVDRFAAPVLAEQAAAAERAGKAYLSTTRRGISDRPLAGAVARNLAVRGVRMDEEELKDTWTAHHLVDGEWLVSLRFRARGRALVAKWVYNAITNTLVSQNRLGTELGYVNRLSGVAELHRLAAMSEDDGLKPVPAPAPRRRTVRKPTRSQGDAAAGRAAAAKVSVITTAASTRSTAKRPTKKSSAPKRAASSRPAKKRGTASRPAAKRPTTKRLATKSPTTKRPTTKRPATKSAATKRAGAPRPAAKRPATKNPTAKRPTTKNPTTKSSAAKRTSAPRPAKKSVQATKTTAGRTTRRSNSQAPPAGKRPGRKA